MAYNSAIPQPTDRISASQAQLLGNFQAIPTLLAVNHGIFGAADEGKHKFVTMPVQTGDPGTLAAEMALFSKTSTVTTFPELFVVSESMGTVLPLSGSVLRNSPAINETGAGWCFLPGGLILYWGRETTNAGPGNANAVIDLSVGANRPTISQILNVQVTIVRAQDTNDRTAWSRNITQPSTFTVRTSTFAGAAVSGAVFFYSVIAR